MSKRSFMIVAIVSIFNASFAVDFLENAKEINARDYERKQYYKQKATERRINGIKERFMLLDQEEMLISLAKDKEVFYKLYHQLNQDGAQRLSTIKENDEIDISELFRRITEDTTVEKIASHNRKHTKQLTHQVSGWDFVQTQMPWQWRQIVLSTKKTIKNFYNKFDPIVAAIEYDGKASIQLSATITRKDFINDIQGITNVSIKNENQLLNLVLSIRHDDEKEEIHISHFFPNESKRFYIQFVDF